MWFFVVVYNNKDLSEFVKNSDQTVGTIIGINQAESIQTYKGYDTNENRYYDQYVGIKVYDYTFEYYIGAEQYKETFSIKKETIKVDSFGRAKSELEQIKPKYNYNDEITVYYNINNHSDYRLDINFMDDRKLNLFMIIIIGILVIKSIFIIKELNFSKDNNNL